MEIFVDDQLHQFGRDIQHFKDKASPKILGFCSEPTGLLVQEDFVTVIFCGNSEL
jgi:hypothetical protein